MLDVLKKRLEQLLDSLIDPVWQRLLALRWQMRALISLIFLSAAYGVYSPESVKSAWGFASSATRVFSAGAARIPISDGMVGKLTGLSSRLSSGLAADLDLLAAPPREDITAWYAAQSALAVLQPDHLIDSKNITLFFRSSAEPACGCWREIPRNTGKPRNIFISGWVLRAMAEMGEPATPDEIRFLLNEQQQDGSWSVYPISNGSLYASSYGTAWALLGLNAQLQLGMSDRDQAVRSTTAIKRGTAWLLAHRQPGSRWKDYPLAPNGSISEGISGVVLHALHETVAHQQLEQLDSDWLDSLPAGTVKIGDFENTYVYFTTKDGFANDDFVQLRLPWLVIGIVDAYSYGTLLQRAKAVLWLEKALDQENVLLADTQPAGWLRAELLLSINYLLRNQLAAAKKND